MKRKKIIIAVIVVLTAIIAVASCDNSSDNVDPIHGTVPEDTTFWSGENGNIFPLEEFYRLGRRGDTVAQRELVDQYRKVLTANVLRHYPQIKTEKNIKFILGSGLAKDVKSGDGKYYSGKFTNELIIILNDPCVRDTLFLACGNGMLEPLEFYSQTDLGTAAPWRIVIQPGEGLAHHLPELQAWAEVAGALQIPIKDKRGNVVSKEIYINYLGKYSTLLYPYDVIDVREQRVYDEKGRLVDFSLRLPKANKKDKR